MCELEPLYVECLNNVSKTFRYRIHAKWLDKAAKN